MNPKRQACIVGVGQTEFTRHGGIMNRSQFRKFGIKVAELVATMRPVP